MDWPRRRFVLTGAGLGVTTLAGCLGTPDGTGDPGDDADDGNDDDGTGSCDPIALPLVDDPPHDPERPPRPDRDGNADDWDEHYLGEGMDDTTSVSFERVNLQLTDQVVDPAASGGEAVVYAALLTSREDLDSLAEPADDDSEAVIEEIDYDTQAVVAVVTGFGSSSVTHEWVSVDENCEELHVHGYYTQPIEGTADYSSRVSGLVVEQPSDAELAEAWVSLTVDEDNRFNFSTSEDAQSIDGDDDDDAGSEEDVTGPVESVDVIPAESDAPGVWRSEGDNDEPDAGVAVELPSEDDVQAVIRDEAVATRFIEMTDFDTDYAYFVESAGPNACYTGIEFGEVGVVANDDGYFLATAAEVVDESGDGEGCADVVTHPGALIRVEAEVDLDYGEFRIEDGWGTETTVTSEPVTEFDAW